MGKCMAQRSETLDSGCHTPHRASQEPGPLVALKGTLGVEEKTDLLIFSIESF